LLIPVNEYVYFPADIPEPMREKGWLLPVHETKSDPNNQ